MKNKNQEIPDVVSTYSITDTCRNKKNVILSEKRPGKNYNHSFYFKGHAIYNPSGKAGEYSYWATNFYTGCPNKCNYCYCKILLRGIWTDYARLKSCFKTENHAIQIFKKELVNNLPELQKNGLFFSFTTDPLLEETIYLTHQAAIICAENKIPVKILSKEVFSMEKYNFPAEFVIFGKTLTGRDDMEHGAAKNTDRINEFRTLKHFGFKTFASIEPIIDIKSSLTMIRATSGLVDHYKIGILSGKKYEKKDLVNFINLVTFENSNAKIYFKDSLLNQAEIKRENLPANCVTRDFNINLT